MSDSSSRSERHISRLYFWGGGVGIILILLGLGLSFWLNREQPSEPASQNKETQNGTASQAKTAIADGKELGVDLVRINVGGDAVIAGHAPSEAWVTLALNKQEIGSVVTDEKGEWVFLSEAPLPGGHYSLTLQADLPDDRKLFGRESILIIVPERPLLDDSDDFKKQQPIVLLMPQDETSPSRLLNQQFEADKTPIGPHFTLDTIDYGRRGVLILGGRIQTRKADLIVYLNNRPIARDDITGKGATPVAWSIQAEPPQHKGLYNLRIDMIDEGKVVLRRTLPFEWADPELLDEDEDYFIVQPGNNLWYIARRVLGGGGRYTVLYDANRDQIEDPDLIYPGQIFIIPRKNNSS